MNCARPDLWGAGEINSLVYPTCARLKPGRLEGDGNISETSHWNPAGSQPRPAKRAGSRNRVLRGVGATLPAKRTQGVCRPCD